MKTLAAVLLVGLSYSASAMETALSDDMRHIISQNIQTMLQEDQRRLTAALNETTRFTLPKAASAPTRSETSEKPATAKTDSLTFPASAEDVTEKPHSAK